MYSKHGFASTIPGGQNALFIFLFTSDCNNQVQKKFPSQQGKIGSSIDLHRHEQYNFDRNRLYYVLDCNIVHFVQMISDAQPPFENPSDHKKGDPMRMIDKNEHTHISIRITNENHILKISTLDFGNISCNLFHIWVCL